MTGILNAQQTAPNAAPVENSMPPEGRANQSGAPQEVFDKLVANGLQILHSSEVSNSIIKRVNSSRDKIEAIGEAALDVVERLEDSAEKNGLNTTNAIIAKGLNVIVGEVINIAEAAGVQPLSDEQKYQAFSWSISNYIDRAVKSGKVSKEQIIQAGQSMAQGKKSGPIAQQMGLTGGA